MAAPAALLMTNPHAKFLNRQRSSLPLALSVEVEWNHCGYLKGIRILTRL